MEVAHVAAALLSALLHAGWNAAVKASARPTEAMAAQMLMSAVLVVPGLLWTGLPIPASWIWLAASTLMNIVTVSALLRAYALGGFGVVYPVVRAVSVLLVVPLAAWLVGDRLGLAAIAGIGLVAVRSACSPIAPGAIARSRHARWRGRLSRVYRRPLTSCATRTAFDWPDRHGLMASRSR
jgi:hypothetical protein